MGWGGRTELKVGRIKLLGTYGLWEMMTRQPIQDDHAANQSAQDSCTTCLSVCAYHWCDWSNSSRDQTTGMANWAWSWPDQGNCLETLVERAWSFGRDRSSLHRNRAHKKKLGLEHPSSQQANQARQTRLVWPEMHQDPKPYSASDVPNSWD